MALNDLNVDAMLAGRHSRTYEAFVANDGREVPAGTSRFVYFAVSMDEAPIMVRVTEAEYDRFGLAPLGSRFQVQVSRFAAGRGRDEYRLQGVTEPLGAGV